MKYNFKIGVLTALSGICIAIFGSIQKVDYPTVRMGGYIIAIAGMTLMGIRLYEQIKDKVKISKRLRMLKKI